MPGNKRPTVYGLALIGTLMETTGAHSVTP